MCDFYLPVPLRSSPYSSLARPIRMENHLVLISASLTPFPVTSEEKEGNCDFYMAPFLSPFISLLLFSSSDQKGKWSRPDFCVPHSLASSPSVKENQRASFIFRVLSFASFQPPFSFFGNSFLLIFVHRCSSYYSYRYFFFLQRFFLFIFVRRFIQLFSDSFFYLRSSFFQLL